MRKIKNAVLDLEGAHCAFCVYTIEHLGRKVQGVKDIKVNTPNHENMV
jgi:copper chaperone CopZ